VRPSDFRLKVKQSLAWLWLTGAVLYALSTFLSVDVPNHMGGENPGAVPPAVAKGQIPTQKSESVSDAPNEPIAAASSSSLDLASAAPQRPSDRAEEVSALPRTAPAARFVVRSAANIRNGPSSQSNLIGTAPEGAELEAAERTGRWVRFVDPVTSYTGWIYDGLLEESVDDSAFANVEQSDAALGATDVESEPDVGVNAPPPTSGAAKPKPNVRARNALAPAKTVAKPKAETKMVRPSGRRARGFALGYANSSTEELAKPKRRFGFFARRRMAKQRALGE
jgi:hypothetical protein